LYRNGVDINRFKGLENEILRPPLKLIYAGLLGVAQGILSICQAIDFKTYNMELHIYGDGAERKDIENFVTQNPDKGIYLNQPVHRNEIPNLLKQHHIALIPLIKPIFGAVPSKIYEAMASGLPILFAGGGEGADIVTQYQAGWICQPANFMEMSKILKKIGLKPEKELQVYRKNCELAALTVFDRSIQIRQLHQVLTNSL
jgi:glycosyltransferase involved in cell wall biosynthesis